MNKINTPLENVIKIMNIVIKRLETKKPGYTQKTSFITKLLEKGYKPEDIELAMNMVTTMTSKINPILNMGDRETLEDGTPLSVRHLHAFESARLTFEAQNIILKLVEENLISSFHFEKALEYMWQNDLREVDPVKLKLVLALSKPIYELENEFFEQSPVSLEMH